MIFGRSRQQQSPNPQNPGSAQGTEGAGTGYMPPQAPQASPWTGMNGYPTQPSGTGYAGYTPGGAQPNTGGFYGSAGYTAQGQDGNARNAGYGSYAQGTPAYGGQGYTQAGGYSQAGAQYPQMGQSYAPGAAQAAPGYSQPGQGYAQAGAPGSMQGYAQPGQGYTQAGTGGYAQPGQGYGQMPQGYAQAPQGYAASQNGYGYPQMNASQNYSGQPGYQGPAYSNAYAQMGRNQAPQQDYSSQIPLNGGGYVPPAVPVRKQPFVFKSWMLIALGGLLLILLVAGLFVPSLKALLWVFLVLAVGSTAFFWIKPLVSGNRRLCYTIIFGVLALVALLSVTGVLSPKTDSTRTAGTPGGSSQSSSSASSGSGSVVDAQTGDRIDAVDQPTAAPATPTPAPADDSATTDRLEAFFRYWSANRYDEMLTLCAPSWQSSVDNPKTSLFGLMANRTPLDYTVEKISGTQDDTSRTVTVTSTMDRNNGKDPVKYRLSVLMVKESDQWFVDPQSLKTYDEAETPDPALAPTPTPTLEPAADANTVLYYNPDGGTKYHRDQNCKSTHAKYLPMKGHFTYGEINDAKYANLSPCNVCAAPLRP